MGIKLKSWLWTKYCDLYATLLSCLERHQPGVGGMALPNRIIVSVLRFDGADQASGEVERSVARRPPEKFSRGGQI